jgi:hypothetical protein
MSLMTTGSRARVLASFVLAACAGVQAAPTTSTNSYEEDNASSHRQTRGSGNGTSDSPTGDSRTMQMLLDLQNSRAPLEGGERSRLAPTTTASPVPLAPQSSTPVADQQNPFSRALEIGKPAVTRELRGPNLASTSSGDQPGRPVSPDVTAAMRGERFGDVPSRGAEQALREKIGGEIPVPVALLRYLRENRTTVLMISLLSLAVVGWAGARATQKRR